MSAREPTRRQRLWRQSDELKEIGAAALERWREEQRAVPKCGARTKKTGEPCQARALENGRCKVHGGLTPKGDDWHKPRFTARTGFYERKLARKLQDLEKRRKKAAERVAAMSPERRARYEQWHRTHKPTSMNARAVARREAAQAAECRALLAAHDDQRTAKPHSIDGMAQNPALGGLFTSQQEITMPKPKSTPAEVAASLRQKMQAEGVAIAYEALKDVAANKEAPAQARATAATSILRAAGMFDKAATPDETPIEELPPDQMLARIDRRLAELQGSEDDDHGDLDADDGERPPNVMD